MLVTLLDLCSPKFKYFAVAMLLKYILRKDVLKWRLIHTAN